MHDAVLWWWLLSFLLPSSLAQSVVTVFLNTSYQGDNLSLPLGSTGAPLSDWTQSISSVKVLAGYEFVGYAQSNFAGIHMKWSSDAPSLGSIWDDKIASFIVREKSNDDDIVPIIVYSEMAQKGNSLPLSLGKGTLEPQWQQHISSLQVTPGYELEGFDQDDNSNFWISDSPYIDTWNNRIISYEVRLAQKHSHSRVRDTTIYTYIAIVVAVAVAIIAAIGLYATFYVRRIKAEIHEKTRTPNPTINPSLPPTPTSTLQLDLTELCKYRINDNDLDLIATVGFGAFAEVWKGVYNREIVAVKRLLPNQNADSNIESFINEIKLFATFNSPNIVRLIGVAWTTPLDLKCVMELMDLGDLRDYLSHHDKKSFPWKEKLECLKSIASGLNYLHSLSVVHRDLKSRNVLMDSSKGTKLVDFGVAKEDLYGTMTVAVGTFRWMAPEVLHDTSYNTSADVYSFGMVLTEMDSHQIPYQDIRNPKTGQPLADPAIIAGVMNGSIKPSFSDECPQWLTSIAEECLKLDPSERPTMYQVVAQLVKVVIE